MSSGSDQYYSDEEENSVVNNTSSGRSSKSSRLSSQNSKGDGVVIDETESEEESSQVVGQSEESEESEVESEEESADSDDDIVRPPARSTKKKPLGISSDSEDKEEDDLEGNVRSPARNTKRKTQAIPSESEDEDEELEQRALSPSTRMSITGVRVADFSDGDSEIEYLDEEQEAPPAAAGEALVPRYTTHFAGNIQETLHSTLGPADLEPLDDSSGSDVLILSNKETPIEVLSSTDDDASHNKENMSGPPFMRPSRPFSPRSSAGAPVVKTTKNLSQPTIQAALKQRTSPSAPVRSRVKSEDQQVVSQVVFDEEMRKLAEKRVQLSDAEKLFEKVAHKLPDKGSQIRKRIDTLRLELEGVQQYVKGLKVEPSKIPASQAVKPAFNAPKTPSLDAPDWDELSAAVHEIQPVYTGAQGMATFNNQKALTLESLKDLHGSLKDCPGPEVLAEDPQGLKVKLMEHQKHALAWMSWRERQLPRGGILADDMGLGKTLTMISSVLACKNRQERSEAEGHSSDSDSEDDKNKKRKSTAEWTSKGRKDTHKGGTLVVCPASLLRQWESEVESKVARHKLTVCVHHGNNRETKGKHLRTYDIVVTTYQIVAREHKNLSAVFGVKWRRIILDEAHVVRNHKSQSSLAVSDLRGKYRWALTGTPIQNKELDVYALLKFLRCSPFDDLHTWKKWIDNKSAGGQNRLNLLMKSLMLRRTKAQLQLDGKLNNLPNKELRLMEISLGTEEMNVYQTVMTYSKTLFAQFLHQRAEKDTEFNYRSDANKPTYNQIKDPNGAYYKMHEKFSKMAGSQREVKSHEILVLLLRLRQICCHPGLIDAMLDGEDARNVDGQSSDSDSPEIDLLAQLNKLAITDTSIESKPSVAAGADTSLPLGADEARIAKASKNLLKRTNPVFNLNRPSSKISHVIKILKTSILKDTNDKAIVVSQWTSVLDILRDHLHKDSVPTLSLNGTIPVKNRQDIVNQFNDPNNPKRVLLLSLTAGGVGLNLIGANHLLLLDLHWNPQLEAQAQDRIYRVGQKKDVIIYKFMCVDTVEQRIKALQDKKLELANGVLTGSTVSSKLTIDDLKGLFGM
ncbi:transcription termination factor 2 isoform X2 [Drosophila biarmipes]|uniref:transcription termination factor 2 isoform X2 n=1 Tax=Drosophila biarmipes TaxID=125945 RepID=UPI0007E7E7C2|nr:transcription termination factor 2 isoform X2 [Drosophila biarmipes]